MSPAVPAIETRDFRAEPTFDGQTVAIHVRGSCDMDVNARFASFLTSIHKEALRVRARRVRVDCEELYFMNSTAMKDLAVWVKRIASLTSEQRYEVVFRMNPRVSWHRRSLEALGRFAPTLVKVEP